MSEASTHQITLVTDGPDGTTAKPYTRADASPEDLHVKQRHTANNGTDIITEYAGAPDRPIRYPDWLPFVPLRPVFTTESAPGGMSPGARWPCTNAQEAADVWGTVERESIASGWTAEPTLSLPGADGATKSAVFVRDQHARVLDITDAGSVVVLGLIEIPRGILHDRTV